MIARKFVFQALVLSIALQSGLSLAAEAPATSTVNQGSFLREELKNIGLSADSRLYGPSIVDPLSPVSPNQKTGKRDSRYPLSTENKLHVSYRLNSSVTTGLTLWSTWQPVMEHKFKWSDPSIFLRKSGLIQAGNYRLNGAVRLLGGFSELSQRYGQAVQLRLEQDSSYMIPETAVKLGMYGFAQKNFLVGNKKGAWTSQYLFIPSVGYRIAKNLSTDFSYKLWLHHVVGDPSLKLVSERAQVGPGLLWNPLPNVGVNPYFDVALNDRVALDTTTLGLYLTWRML